MAVVAQRLVAAAAWAWLRAAGSGRRVSAGGQSPRAADTGGISVARTRWTALVGGGAVMALGGSFLPLSGLGAFTLDIVSGRGWVCVALVIFGRWKVWPVV